MGVVNCAFGINTNFVSVKDVCSWIMRIPGKIRNVMAVGIAAIFWAVWKTRNKACFENVFPYDPSRVIVQAAH